MVLLSLALKAVKCQFNERLPKFGFKSRVGFVTDQVTLTEISKVEGDTVTLQALKDANLVKKEIQLLKSS